MSLCYETKWGWLAMPLEKWHRRYHHMIRDSCSRYSQWLHWPAFKQCDDIIILCDEVIRAMTTSEPFEYMLWWHHVITSSQPCDDVMWWHHLSHDNIWTIWVHVVMTSCNYVISTMWWHRQPCDDITRAMWWHHFSHDNWAIWLHFMLYYVNHSTTWPLVRECKLTHMLTNIRMCEWGGGLTPLYFGRLWSGDVYLRRHSINCKDRFETSHCFVFNMFI